MREGNDLNQQGHAGRQEQASSKSPATFHEVFASAPVIGLVLQIAAMPPRMRRVIDRFIGFMTFLLFFTFLFVIALE